MMARHALQHASSASARPTASVTASRIPTPVSAAWRELPSSHALVASALELILDYYCDSGEARGTRWRLLSVAQLETERARLQAMAFPILIPVKAQLTNALAVIESLLDTAPPGTSTNS